MPPKKFKNITITEEIYNKLKQYMDKVNSKYGYRKYRSIAQLVEDAIMSYIQNMQKEQ